MESAPMFQITGLIFLNLKKAQDSPQPPIVSNSATGAWQIVVKAAMAIRGNQGKSSVSGYEKLI
jgi:hypothetical protein